MAFFEGIKMTGGYGNGPDIISSCTVNVNQGEIDFIELGRLLKEVCPNSTFIPEVWQGHKDKGEGFWKAFQRLEKFF